MKKRIVTIDSGRVFILAILALSVIPLLLISGCLDTFAGKAASVFGINNSAASNGTAINASTGQVNGSQDSSASKDSNASSSAQDSVTTTTRDEITARFNKIMYGIDDDKSRTQVQVTQTDESANPSAPAIAIPSQSTSTTMAQSPAAAAQAIASAATIPPSATIPPTTTTLPGNVVLISYKKIDPVEVDITPGENVTWINTEASRVHMMVERNQVFRSPRIMPGTSYTFTFNSTGTYTYIDAIDSDSIAGRIVVS